MSAVLLLVALALAGPPAGAAEPLPAGIYFRDHTYKRCERDGQSCDTPTVARITGVYPDLEAARAALARAPSLAPGYPLAAHTDELGLDDPREGIVIVVGLYPSVGAAGPAAPGTELVPLRKAREAFGRLAGFGYRPRWTAVRIVPGKAVPAYAAADVRAFQGLPTGATLAAAPICEVPGGALFLAAETDLFHYTFAPVECGGRLAYVAWRRTLVGAVIVRKERGWVMQQVVGAACDTPEVEEQAYDPAKGPVAAVGAKGGGGCGD